MTQIKISIDCDGVYCGSCEFLFAHKRNPPSNWECTNKALDWKDRARPLRVIGNGSPVRAVSCLAATVEE